MAAIRIHHAATTVRNMEASLRFYRDLLGLRVVDDDVLSGDDISKMVGLQDVELRAVLLSADDNLPYVELIEYHRPHGEDARNPAVASDIGTAHFCFLVPAMGEAYRRLQEDGVRFTAPPFVATEGRFAGDWSTYCFDPDGFIVELWSHEA